jgi:hypothetical protein
VTSERLSRPRSARSSRNKQADCPVRTNLCVTTLRLCAQAKASNAVVSAKLLARPPVILCQASSEPVARIELHSRMLTHEGHLSCKFQTPPNSIGSVDGASDVSSWSHFVSSQSCVSLLRAESMSHSAHLAADTEAAAFRKSAEVSLHCTAEG